MFENIQRVLVCGGGRWSRVLCGVLLEIIPPSSEIYIYTKHNCSGMQEWSSKMSTANNVVISEQLPLLDKKHTDAAIIVNAARDHFSIAKSILLSGIPVLVEKPMTLSSRESQELISIAKTNNVMLCAAHVFLFANYIVLFSGIARRIDDISSVSFAWSDAKNSYRYGESKSYDYTIPVYLDCLPHIISIISFLYSSADVSYDHIVVCFGGAELIIWMKLDSVPFKVRVARDAEKRERTIHIIGRDELKLDFAKEPGLIFRNNNIITDNAKGDVESPVRTMLTSFLSCCTSSKNDSRFDPLVALKANSIIDSISEDYYANNCFADNLLNLDKDYSYYYLREKMSNMDSFSKKIFDKFFLSLLKCIRLSDIRKKPDASKYDMQTLRNLYNEFFNNYVKIDKEELQ